MSAMETMAKNLLKALGIDPEALQLEFTTRVEQFEKNIDRLNEHLLQINLRLTNIQVRLAHMEKHLGVSPYVGTNLAVHTENGKADAGIGDTVSQPRIEDHTARDGVA
jgi:hypothetical protein